MKYKLIITWKPDVLSMVQHKGSKEYYGGATCRSEVESFKNIKSVEAAKILLNRRNKENIIVAKYNGEVL